MRVRSLRADFLGGTLWDIQGFLDTVSYRLCVSGRTQRESGMRDLPVVFAVPIDIHRNDDLYFSVQFDKKLDIGAPFLLRVVLAGITIQDLR